MCRCAYQCARVMPSVHVHMYECVYACMCKFVYSLMRRAEARSCNVEGQCCITTLKRNFMPLHMHTHLHIWHTLALEPHVAYWTPIKYNTSNNSGQVNDCSMVVWYAMKTRELVAFCFDIIFVF